ncbi:unnamed protein product, partial [Iphiclides podalirius]
MLGNANDLVRGASHSSHPSGCSCLECGHTNARQGAVLDALDISHTRAYLFKGSEVPSADLFTALLGGTANDVDQASARNLTGNS